MTVGMGGENLRRVGQAQRRVALDVPGLPGPFGSMQHVIDAADQRHRPHHAEHPHDGGQESRAGPSARTASAPGRAPGWRRPPRAPTLRPVSPRRRAGSGPHGARAGRPPRREPGHERAHPGGDDDRCEHTDAEHVPVDVGPAVGDRGRGPSRWGSGSRRRSGGDGDDRGHDDAHDVGSDEADTSPPRPNPIARSTGTGSDAGPDRPDEGLTDQHHGGEDHRGGEEQQGRAFDVERPLHPFDVVGEVLHRDVVTAEHPGHTGFERGYVGGSVPEADQSVVEPGGRGRAGSEAWRRRRGGRLAQPGPASSSGLLANDTTDSAGMRITPTTRSLTTGP